MVNLSMLNLLQKSEFQQFIKNCVACQMGNAIVAMSEIDLVKPKATAAEFYATFGKEMPTFKKVTLVTNVRSYSYEGNIEKQQKKAGAEVGYTTDSTPYTYIVYPVIKQHNASGQMYFVYSTKLGDTATRKYTAYCKLEGDEATPITPEEQSFIEQHLRPKKTYVCQKQLDAGIAEENTITPYQYKLDNIIAYGRASELQAIFQRYEIKKV